jgi:hypothetical protein
MPADPPVACSLTAAEMPKRLAEMASIGDSSLITARRADALAVLRFRAAADTRERLEAVVAAESECCAFLSMELREEPNALELRIAAPDGAEPVIDQLVAAFTGKEQAA